MTINHHPHDSTLAAFAAGTLDEGRRVAVAAHAATCPSCRRVMRGLETIGGEVLAADAAPLAEDALERTLARLDEPAPAAAPTPDFTPDDLPDDAVPKVLRLYEMGKWRWIGKGLYWRSVFEPADGGARVFLLKARPGTRLPEHTHTGIELTQVLTGAFVHEGGRFAAGDIEEADDEVEHRPVVDGNEDCICLVAMDGQLKLTGMFGRFMQPFVRI